MNNLLSRGASFAESLSVEYQPCNELWYLYVQSEFFSIGVKPKVM
jgi:hypothetical protein